jgi:hypothetical protein
LDLPHYFRGHAEFDRRQSNVFAGPASTVVSRLVAQVVFCPRGAMGNLNKAAGRIMASIPPVDVLLGQIAALKKELAKAKLESEAARAESKTPSTRAFDFNEEAQCALLEEFKEYYRRLPFSPEARPDRRYFFENPNYSFSDGIILYCMMRHLQPSRILAIGSGCSSCAMLDVNELFFDKSIACTFVDPQPPLPRDLVRESDQQRIRIVGDQVQNVDTTIFRELRASDILFIDSSHVARTGSDMNYVIFEVLPLLAKGVHIHFHDILYPFEYRAELLRAFLSYNQVFRLTFFTNYMLQKNRGVFEADMPLCLKGTGGSLWLEKMMDEA